MGKKTWITLLGISIVFIRGFYTLYNLCRPPLADLKSSDDIVVVNQIPIGEMLRLEIHIGEEKLSHDSEPISTIDVPFDWNYAKHLQVHKKEKRSWYLVDPTAEYHTSFTIPDTLRKDSPIFIHLLARNITTGVPLSHRFTYPFSISLLPSEANKDKRLLLKPIDHENSSSPVATHSVPPNIEVGMMIEDAKFSYDKLVSKGLRSLIKLPKWKGKKINKGHLMLNLTLNSYVSPRDEYISLTNDKVDPIEIRIKYKPQSFALYFFYLHIEQSLNRMEQLGIEEYDIDSMRLTMTGAAPWIVCLTFFVSVLHFLLEVLFLSSEFSYWNSAIQYVRLSQWTVIFSIVNSIISLLYLTDSGASKLIAWFPLARAACDVWKLHKLHQAKNAEKRKKERREKRREEKKLLEESQMAKDTDSLLTALKESIQTQEEILAPVESKKPEELEGISEKELDDYEAKVLKKLSIFGLIPCVLGYMTYTLLYVPQKGWYSWVIRSLAACSYAFGFLSMLPQVIRNSKLRSVEHLPWTALTYQAINTFIDDLFVLLIRHPDMHKASVFRDDIVFVILQIQKYMYRKKDPKPLSDKKEKAE